MKVGPLKILVVDDEDMIGANLKAFLEDEGFDVQLVSTGKEGIAILSTDDSIDIAIVDIRLPDTDGDEVILQSLPKTKKTHYIVHTGSTEYVLPQSLLELGVTKEQVLFKPLVDMQILLDLIEKLLKK